MKKGRMISALAFAAAAAVAGIAHQVQAGEWGPWGTVNTATTCYTDTSFDWGPGHTVINGNNHSQTIGWCDDYECGPGGYILFTGCTADDQCETLESFGGSVSTWSGGPDHVKHRCMVLGVAGATW